MIIDVQLGNLLNLSKGSELKQTQTINSAKKSHKKVSSSKSMMMPVISEHPISVIKISITVKYMGFLIT
jgi:hypothetical protein